jgi:hypothetical protein
MKRIIKKNILAAVAVVGIVGQAFAGNPQRAGSAGASELLINPYARSSGWADVSLGAVRGSNSFFVNIAGLSFIEKTDIRFENTQWLVNTGIQINSLSFIQRVSDNGVLGVAINGFDYGEWEVTTATQPDGTSGVIKPAAIVINIAYSQKFTESIYGGINIKAYNSSISNMKTTGLCFDAGVQYIPENNDAWKFGITLKNIGPALKYSGDGSSVILPVPTFGTSYTQAWDGKTATFELPTQLAMGLSYDFTLAEDHRLTAAGAFTSNSFEKDFFQVGAEYSFKEVFMVRGGYKIYNQGGDDLRPALTGLTAGFTAQLPLSKENKGSFLGLDYSYRATNPFQGVHSVGIMVGF